MLYICGVIKANYEKYHLTVDCSGNVHVDYTDSIIAEDRGYVKYIDMITNQPKSITSNQTSVTKVK